MAEIVGRAGVAPYMQQFESLRADRVDFDRKWQMVSDYILPRRDFSVTQQRNQLRPHRVTSSVATNANSRMAALVLAYLIDPTRPFLSPNVKRGLVAAGRSTDLDDGSLDYLGDLGWSIFSHMTLPRAQLMLRLGSMLKEFCAFGCGVLWTGRRRGFGPYFNNRSLQACWWSENEEGVIDTLYFKMMLPLYRVLQRYPKARTFDGWSDQWAKVEKGQACEQTTTSIIMACKPRLGGRPGAVAEAKPFELCTFSEDKKEVLEETGYDSFPYSVFRYDPMPGATYAEGPGCQVLPDVMVLNHFQQAIEDGSLSKAQPSIAVPARMFGKTLDRRYGAVNAYNPSGLGLMRADQAIIKLDFTGEITDAVAIKQSLTNDIELGYFVDWLRLREQGDMTAEEVVERRDMRLRGMSSIVANCEQPMTALGDRAMEIMGEEGLIKAPPQPLGGVDVDWEYSGPLAIAQLRGNVQSILQLMNAAALVAKTDQAAAQAVDLEESLRAIQEGLAAPPTLMATREKVAAARAALAQQQQQQADAEKAATLAQAGRDAGQGIASVAGAGADVAQAQAQTGAPQAAPFAPAAPFAQSIAA